MPRSRIIYGFAVLSVAWAAVFCFGCTQAEETQAQAAPARQPIKKPTPPPPPAPKAEEEAKKEWRYDPTEKWDPFTLPPPPVSSKVPATARYDLDQMLLLGIIRGSGMDGAYIRFPDGSDRIIRVGDILGKHRGEVKEIGKDYIIVEERYLSPEQPNDTFIIEKVLKIVDLKKRGGR